MFLRSRLPLILVLFAGIAPITSFFISEDVGWARFVTEKVRDWMVIIAAFALLLGVVNVTQNSLRRIERREKGWFFSLSLLVGLFTMSAFGILSAFEIGRFQGIGRHPVDGGYTPFYYVYRHVFNPLQAAMFSLLAFYIASAAFRAFRVRNVEATILLTAAMIVMLGRIPAGEYVFSWIPGGGETFSRFVEWLMNTPNAASQRGIMIGAALGAASLSLRVILGIERAYLGTEK